MASFDHQKSILSPIRKAWLLDSGCFNHICRDRQMFSDDFDASFSTMVRLSNNTRMRVAGKGSVKVIANGSCYLFSDVYYVPGIINNLLSVGQLQEKGVMFSFKDGMFIVFHPQRGKIASLKMSTNRMYILQTDGNATNEDVCFEC
ncbi:uncharacterized protein [Rutidosis leptorrhynchoides]|uniref:uncharacterized protein n=1 Tax=Rutidosis leptorrhynchoides TaxID=125765 RepID=UPI003A997BCF